MEDNEYVENALRTESNDTKAIQERLSHRTVASLFGALELSITSAEELDDFKKHIFYGKDVDISNPKQLFPDYVDFFDAGTRLSDPTVIRLLHVALGLFTEAGEFAEALLKHIGAAEELDIVNMAEELGDSTWYTAIGSAVLGTSLTEIKIKNINKLKARFPDKFSEVKALNRDLDVEREILEN